MGIVQWDNYHLVEDRDFSQLKLNLKTRFTNADVHSIHWGFTIRGRPYAIVEVGQHSPSAKSKTPAATATPQKPAGSS